METRTFTMPRGKMVLELIGMAGLFAAIVYFFVYPMVAGYFGVEGGDIRTKIIICGLIAAVSVGLAAGMASNLRAKWQTKIVLSEASIANGDLAIVWDDVVSMDLPGEEADTEDRAVLLRIAGRDGTTIVVPKGRCSPDELVGMVQKMIPDSEGVPADK